MSRIHFLMLDLIKYSSEMCSAAQIYVWMWKYEDFRWRDT